MTHRRSPFQLYYNIVKYISEHKECKPTHLLYKTNLSNAMLKNYMKILIDKNIVEEKTLKNFNKRYDLTPQGHIFLMKLHRAMREIHVTEEQFNIKIVTFI